MSSSSTPARETPETQTPPPNETPILPEIKTPIDSTHPNDPEDPKNGSDEEEEEGECGFCLFMKGGGCKEAFTSWEQCVEEGEKKKQNIVEKCHEITSALKMCMDAHADYYAPILTAEKEMEAEVVRELEKEKADEESNSFRISVDEASREEVVEKLEREGVADDASKGTPES